MRVFLISLLNLFFWSAVYCKDRDLKTVSVVWNPRSDSYHLVKDKIDRNWVAWATFKDQAYENGWSFLKVVTNENYPDGVQAYAAGLAEGHLTTKLMRYYRDSFLKHMCDPLTESSPELCDSTLLFMRRNKEWMENGIANFAQTEPYWHQVNLLLRQMRGIQDGCTDSLFVETSEPMLFQEFGFWLFTLSSDVISIVSKFNATLQKDRPSSCSALIKPLANYSDLYVGHATWNFYTTMVRILKNYEFPYHLTDAPGSPIVPGYNITFSSFPGSIQSIDDYYLVSTGLVTLETTLNIYNLSLLDAIQPESVLEGFRVMLANRLAEDGITWSSLFMEFNSGTYNNEWMIVDYNLFEPGCTNLSDGLLWIVEQIPGYCEARDMTSVLRQQGYWASYNIPYFESVYVMSGQENVLDKFGTIFNSYTESFRALIFARQEGQVVDIDSMIAIMRYNDYENDVYSICPNCTPKHNAFMSIAARGDLNPANGTYVPSTFGHEAYGAIDMKVTNFTMFQTLQFIAQSGPTYDQQPPFKWSSYDSQGLKISHDGQPDLWKFKPILADWN